MLYPLALLSDPHYGAIAYHLVVPGIQGGASSTAILLIIAIVGTTVAPWQLFFQQSNVIDKRITPRFIGYERADTTLGAVVVVAGAIAIVVVAVFAVRGTNLVGQFTDALGVAHALEAHGYCARRAVRDRAARREHHRRLGGDPVHQLRVRRRVRPEALAAPQLPRRQAVLRQLRRAGRGGRGHRAHPAARRSG